MSAKSKKVATWAAAGTVALGGVLVGLGQFTDKPDANDFPPFNANPGLTINDLDGKKDPEAQKVDNNQDEQKSSDERPGEIKLKGDAVKNQFEKSNPLISDFCRSSILEPGEGKNNKGGTCVSYPIGEVAKNSVRVTVDNPPSVVNKGKDFKIKIRVEDNKGPLDLNAFTFDETGGAGTTFLENPGKLDKDGRPFAHCHLGITSLKGGINGLPGNDYDAAFKGVQGFKGNVEATVSGLEPGFYRGDVYCSQPGHLILPTAKATQVQAFDTFRFEVN